MTERRSIPHRFLRTEQKQIHLSMEQEISEMKTVGLKDYTND